MILHWSDLVAFYGPEIANYQACFEEAGEATYGLLLCKDTSRQTFFQASRGGYHAEDRLCRSDMWVKQIFDAAKGSSSPVVVAMLINRSSCPDCVRQLSFRVGLRSGLIAKAGHARPRYILAARGLYVADDARESTRKSAFRTLRDAGWEQGVLQMGGTLPARGQELLTEIEGVCGQGTIRLP